MTKKKKQSDTLPIYVDIDSLSVNDWNANEMSDKEFSMLIDNIQRLGFVDPLLVVDKGGTYNIIDGEHRYRAGVLLGMKKLPVVIVNINEVEQQIQTLRMNQIKGDWNPVKFNKLVEQLLANGDMHIDEAAYELGFADPSEFHLLRDLLSESLPTAAAKNEFKQKAADAVNSDDLYKLIYEILNNISNRDEVSLGIQQLTEQKSILLLKNIGLVSIIRRLYMRHVVEQNNNFDELLFNILTFGLTK